MNHYLKFEEFSDRSRSVLWSAEQEARSLNHQYVGTEHILLGLVRDSDCLAIKVLMNLGVEMDQARSDLEQILRPGKRLNPGEIELTPRANRAIGLAMDEARRLDHNYVGTHHLLIGLMREGECVAHGMREGLGLDLDKIRSESSCVHMPKEE